MCKWDYLNRPLRRPKSLECLVVVENGPVNRQRSCLPISVLIQICKHLYEQMPCHTSISSSFLVEHAKLVAKEPDLLRRDDGVFSCVEMARPDHYHQVREMDHCKKGYDIVRELEQDLAEIAIENSNILQEKYLIKILTRQSQRQAKVHPNDFSYSTLCIIHLPKRSRHKMQPLKKSVTDQEKLKK